MQRSKHWQMPVGGSTLQSRLLDGASIRSTEGKPRARAAHHSAPRRVDFKRSTCVVVVATTTTRTCYSHSVLKSYAEQGRNAYAATTTTAGTTGDAACLAVVLDAWLVQLLQPTMHRRDHQTLSTNSSDSSSNSNSTHTRTTHCWIEMIGCMVDQGLWWCLMVYVHNRCIINSSPLAALRGWGGGVASLFVSLSCSLSLAFALSTTTITQTALLTLLQMPCWFCLMTWMDKKRSRVVGSGVEAGSE